MTQQAIGIAVNRQSLGGQTPGLSSSAIHDRSAMIELAELGRNSTAHAGVSLHATVIATSNIRSCSHGLETTKLQNNHESALSPE